MKKNKNEKESQTEGKPKVQRVIAPRALPPHGVVHGGQEVRRDEHADIAEVRVEIERDDGAD